MISQGRYTSASSPATVPKMFVPEIVLRLPEEQANTISKVKLNKIGFGVLKTSPARRKETSTS